MTKIAITGPATGTGTYTLNAPDTASTLDFELPTVGTHLASAQADGMPLGTGGDPVVESGSNSDGEWTRFADGTQLCRCVVDDGIVAISTAASGSNVSGLFLHNWPVPFITDPTAAGSLDALGFSGVWGGVRTLRTTDYETRYFSVNAQASADVAHVVVTANGRWK